MLSIPRGGHRNGTAGAAGAIYGTLSLLPATQYHIAFNVGTPLSMPLTAGVYYPMTVGIYDVNNQPAPIVPTAISLSGGGGSIYADANHSQLISSVTVGDSNNNPAPFWFEGTLARGYTISASTHFLTQSLNVTIQAAAATQLAWLQGIPTITAQACAPASSGMQGYVLAVEDQFGNQTTTSTSILLSSNPTGVIFGQNGCSSGQFSVSLASGSVNLFVQAASAVPTQLIASGSGLTNAIYTVKVNPAPAANFQLASSSVNFPATAVGTSSVQTVSVTNVGNLVGTINSISFSDPSYSQIVDSASCPASFTLTPNSSCTLKIQFKPTQVGADAQTMSLVPATGSTVTEMLSGSGISPALFSVASPANGLVFPGQTIHSDSSPKTVTLTNSGGVAGIPSVSLASSTNFQIQSTNCNQLVAPGASCTVNIIFLPTIVGSMSGTLTYGPLDVSGSLGSLSISGTGLSPALLAAVPATGITFGASAVRTNPSLCMTVVNQGQSPALLTGTYAYLGLAFRYNPAAGCSLPCGSSLAAGQSCQVGVQFIPPVTGTFNDVMEVPYLTGDPTQEGNLTFAVGGTWY